MNVGRIRIREWMRIRPKRLFDGTCSAGSSRTPTPTAETERCARIGQMRRTEPLPHLSQARSPPLGEKQRARPEAGRPPPRCANRIPFSKTPKPKTQDSKLKTQDSKPKTQDSRLKTQDSKLKTQDSKLKTQNARLKTQSSKLKTPFVPDGEKQRERRGAFVAACRTCFFLLLFRRGCRIMPHEQEIFKPRYRETGKIAHNGRVWGTSASGPLRVLPEAAGHFFLSGGGEP